jgi:flagellar FliJ protein
MWNLELLKTDNNNKLPIMKSFKFNLEKVLLLRSWAENEAKIELGQALGALSGIETKLDAAAAAQTEASKTRFAPENSGAEIRLYDNYMQRLDIEKAQLVDEALKAQALAEDARAIWLEKRADLKAMENLKERRHAEYKKDLGQSPDEK